MSASSGKQVRNDRLSKKATSGNSLEDLSRSDASANRTATESSNHDDESWRLPPPKKNLVGLVVSGVIFFVWLVFLIFVMLKG
jgi:hypothetical protein